MIQMRDSSPRGIMFDMDWVCPFIGVQIPRHVKVILRSFQVKSAQNYIFCRDRFREGRPGYAPPPFFQAEKNALLLFK